MEIITFYEKQSLNVLSILRAKNNFKIWARFSKCDFNSKQKVKNETLFIFRMKININLYYCENLKLFEMCMIYYTPTNEHGYKSWIFKYS